MPDFNLAQMTPSDIKLLATKALALLPNKDRIEAVIDGFPEEDLGDLQVAVEKTLEEVNEDDDPEAEEEEE